MPVTTVDKPLVSDKVSLFGDIFYYFSLIYELLFLIIFNETNIFYVEKELFLHDLLIHNNTFTMFFFLPFIFSE